MPRVSANNGNCMQKSCGTDRLCALACDLWAITPFFLSPVSIAFFGHTAHLPEIDP
jgi:hypothetical protein